MNIVSRYISGYVQDRYDTSREWIISDHYNTSRIEFCQKATWFSRIVIENSSPIKSLLPSDRPSTLSFLALWKVSVETIFHFRANMISSNFQAVWGFVSPSTICLSEFTHLEKINPCSNRCLVAVTTMAVRLSFRFRVEDTLLSRASYELLACVITGLLCCFSKIDSTSLRLFQGSRNCGRHKTPFLFWRSTQCYYCPQGCGRSAAGTAGDWRLNEKMRKLDGMDDMRDAHNLGLSHDVVCKSWRPEPDYWTMRTWDHACINSRVEVHVRCVEGALGLGGHVVIGVVPLVVRFHHACAIPSVEFFLSGYCSPIVHLWSDCILWSSISSVTKLLHTFTSRKRVIWGVVVTPPVGYSRPPSVANDPSVTKWIELLKGIFGGFLQSTINNVSPRSFSRLCLPPPWLSELYEDQQEPCQFHHVNDERCADFHCLCL